MKTKLHLVANNHIDREWTYDAQLTRMLTVKFFEDLLEAFRKIPDFQFVLDSQAVPLDDYLELFPGKRDILKKHVSAGRLWAGPWYSAPDCFYLSGESIVRNLLVGHRVAASFGNVSKFGYTPFGWGQVSQLPQIYAGFGIDSMFFYRGADTIKPIYYNWRGADGTEARCIKYHRTNFFDKVFRPVTKKREPVPWDRELDYCGDEVPFMFCDEEHKHEHGFVAQGRHRMREEGMADAIKGFVENESGHFPGGIVLGMNGMDTCFPSVKGLLAIDGVKGRGIGGCQFVYSNLDAFSRELKRAVRRERMDLETHSGEMRHFLPGFGGRGKSESKSTHFYLAAARPRQKSRIARAENLLARNAEPAAALAALLGKPYPEEFLTAAWKHLLKCHPHDTIAGCGVDQIEVDMLNRLDQTINISKGVLNMSLQHIVANIDNTRIGDDELALVVFNPSPFPRREIVPLWLHIPEKIGLRDFEVVEASGGKPVAFEVLERGEMTDRIFRDLTDTSLYVYGELARIGLDVEIGGLGYKTFTVRKARPPRASAPPPLAEGKRMENDFLRVDINPDGTLDIAEKQSGKTFTGLHYFTDTGDNGDPWVRFVPDDNRKYSTKGIKAKIRLIGNSPLIARFEIEYPFMIPKGLEKKNYVMEGYYDSAASSREMVPLNIRSKVTLTKTSRHLDIETEIDNRSTDHLVQVVFPSGLKTRKVFAESAFDVVERAIRPNTKNADPSLVNGEDPFLRFVDVSDGKSGLSILSDSVKGYEPLGDKENSVALNLIRSYTSQIVTIYGRKERRPEQVLTQAQGVQKFHYGIYPHAGTWHNGCLGQAEQLNCPMIPVQTHRSFGNLPPELDFVRFGSAQLALGAFKKAEDGNAVILRVSNPSSKPLESEIEFFRDIRHVVPVNLNEEPLKGGRVKKQGRKIRVRLEPKKIASFKIAFQTSGK
ncbi:MAG: glycoside hydrolase family 38 C-terminal domain-containing protein [Terrimicrobiaceae bacterium]